MQVNVYLNFAGNSEEAFNFYKSVFGGEFNSLVHFNEMPLEGVDIPAEDAGKVMHVGLPIGPNNVLMASDTLPSLGQHIVQGNNVHISVHPDSKADADRIFNALAAGGSIEMPIADQVWGDYYGSLQDKYGIKWMVNYSARG
jgi:PhnB protein